MKRFSTLMKNLLGRRNGPVEAECYEFLLNNSSSTIPPPTKVEESVPPRLLAGYRATILYLAKRYFLCPNLIDCSCHGSVILLGAGPAAPAGAAAAGDDEEEEAAVQAVDGAVPAHRRRLPPRP
jgi:hypothetical protein